MVGQKKISSNSEYITISFYRGWLVAYASAGLGLVLGILYVWSVVKSGIPAACKDYFGIRNFGLNYGWMFTAFGSAGLIMPWVNGRIKDATGRFNLTNIIIILMMLVSAVLTMISRKMGQPRTGSETV